MTKEHFIRIGFIVIGLLHALPASGMLGKLQLERTYGIRIESIDVLIMLQHRALLFALLSLACLVAAFQIHWRWPAAIAALSSMLYFVLIARGHAYGTAIATVVHADYVGISIAIALMAAVAKR